MKSLLSSVLILVIFQQAWAQSASKVYDQAVKNYYDFQYTSAISGFEQTRDYYASTGNTDRQLKSYYYLFMSQFELGYSNDAINNLFDGSDIAMEKFGDGTPEVGVFYIGYGKFYHNRESYDSAKIFYHAALELINQSKEPVIYGEIYANLGYSCDYNGEYDSALYYYQKAAELLEQKLGYYEPYTQWVYASIPYVAQQAGDHQAQVDAAKKSLEISNHIYGTGNQGQLSALRQLAIAYEHNKQAKEMREYFQQCLNLSGKLYGEKSEDYALALTQLGNAYSALNDVDNAVKYNIQSYELYKKLLGDKDPQTLSILRNIGNVYFDGGRNQKAIEYYEQNLTLQIKIQGKKSAELIQPLTDVAQVYEYTGDLEKAKELYQQALDLCVTNSSNMLPETYLNMARVESAMSNYQRTLELLDEALLANLRNNNGDLETEAFIKNNIGVAYKNLGDYETAADYLNESLEIRTELFGENSAKVSQVLSNLGNIQLDKGQFVAAQEIFEKVYNIDLDYYGVDHPEIAGDLMSLASACSGQGNLQKEIDLLLKAEQIYLNADGPESPGLVKIYNNITIPYLDLVLLDEAQKYCDLHRDLVLKLYGKASEQMADNYNLQGMIDKGTGKLNSAFENYKQSIAILEKIFEKPTLDLAAVYNNLGTSYLDYFEYVQAQDHLEASLRIYERVVGKNSFHYQTTWMNLALVEYGRNNYKRASEIYHEILKRKVVNQNDSLFKADVHQNLALVFSVQDKKLQAISELEAALKIREVILGKDNMLVGHLLLNIGNMHENLKNFDQAMSYFSRAEKILKSPSSFDQYGLTKLYLGMAKVSEKQQDFDQSIDYADMALKVIKDDDGKVISQSMYFSCLVQKIDIYYSQYYYEGDPQYLEKSKPLINDADFTLVAAEKQILNDKDRLEFSIWKSLFTSIGVKNALALYRETGDKSYAEEAFYYAERSKANTLIEALRESKVKSFAGLDQKLVERERELTAAIQEIEVQIFKTNESENPAKYANLRDQMFALNREYEEVVTELRSNNRYQKLTNDFLVADLEEIRENLLEEGEAAIEIAAGDSTVNVFFITGDDLQVFSRSAKDAETLDDIMSRTINSLLNTISYQADRPFERISAKVYDLVMADVEQYIQDQSLDISTLTFVPEGMFSYFPFETLKRDGKYLIEDYNIRYSYSLTLSEMLEQDAEYNDNKALLSFAPVFEDESTSTITWGARQVFTASSAQGGEELRGFSVNGEFISALPGTKAEVDAIEKLVTAQGHKSQKYLYEAASEEAIKSGILKEYQYIHFATHGFVNEAAPAYSGVFLSQDENSEEDCILFASEIYGLDIQADLVTLSACETGLGKYAQGEGIVGLTRAFLYAGAKNLLVSQWQVSDASTAKMMVDFYDHILKGEDKTKALREAKLALINDPEFSQPYYWAPFVLVGK